MLSEPARNAAAQAVTAMIGYVEVYGEVGRLFVAPITGWSQPVEGSQQTTISTVAHANGEPREYVAFTHDGQPVSRDSTDSWSFSRKVIQQGAKVTLTWTYTQP